MYQLGLFTSLTILSFEVQNTLKFLYGYMGIYVKVAFK